MLELKFIRENRELVKEMLANRNSSIDLAEFDKLDEERRNILGEVELLKQKRNILIKYIKTFIKFSILIFYI